MGQVAGGTTKLLPTTLMARAAAADLSSIPHIFRRKTTKQNDARKSLKTTSIEQDNGFI